MMKKGCGMEFVINKRQDLIYAFGKNSVYQYHFPDFSLMKKQEVYSNISGLLLSEAETKLAVLNTAGKMAILDLEDWSILWKDKKRHQEGSLLTFTENDTKIIRADWDGLIMQFDLTTEEYESMYDFKNRPLKHWVSVYYDKYRKRLTGVSEFELGLCVSNLSPVKFEKVTFDNSHGVFEGEDRGLVIGSHYYVNFRRKSSNDYMILFNEKETLNIIQLPKNKSGRYAYISDDGEYIIVKASELMAKDLIIVYHFPDMEIVQKIYLDDVCMVKLLQDNRTLLIGTWKGIFQERIR